MGLPGIHTGAWTLLICLSWGHVRQALAGPQYMVVCPAVLQAGVETKLCASLLQPNESLVMTVTLMSEDSQTVLLETTTDEDFHTCIQFQAPSVKNKEVQSLAVAVKGDTFYSTADRRVLFQPYVPMTFVQTDKPIYLPGQTVHFRVVSLDTKLRPALQNYSVIELKDSKNNRIGQWLNQTSVRKILQLSYSLNSEAGEGTYSINVKTDTQEIKHDFKVEAYVLPRFEVQLSTLDEISTLQNDLKVDVCARYTFGQPVSGSAELKICNGCSKRQNSCSRETPTQSQHPPAKEEPKRQVEKALVRDPKRDAAGPQKLPYSVWNEPESLPEPPNQEPPAQKKAGSKGGPCSSVSGPSGIGHGSPTANWTRSGITRRSGSPEPPQSCGDSASSPELAQEDSLHKESRIHPEEEILTCLGQDRDQSVSVPLPQAAEQMQDERTGRSATRDRGTISAGRRPGRVGAPGGSAGRHSGLGGCWGTPGGWSALLHWTPSLWVGLTAGLTAGLQVKAVHYNNSAAAGIEVKLLEAKTWARKLLQTLKTDEEGIAAFSLNTSDFQTEIKLWTNLSSAVRRSGAERGGAERSFTITTRNKLLRCDAEETISIQYSIIGEEVVTVDVIHLVLSRGAIIMHGFNKIDLKNQPVDVGEVSFQFKVSPDMSPGIQVVAYASLPSEKVVTQNAEFSTETCFNHKVSLEFSSMSAVPGEDTTMQMIAQPDSLCGVNIVDQSVLIKEPGKILDADKVFNLLPAISTNVPTEVQDYRSCFQGLGLKMVTNLQSSYSEAYKRRSGVKYRKYSRQHHSRRYSNNFRMSKEELPPVETIRSFFPETWIWDLVEIGDSGRKDVPLKVPDTITTWETEAFCLSSQGFGLAPRQNFTVFQPFFLELTMPYSVIRGENFELKATIFSYLISCIMVSVTPSPSSDYTLTPLSDDQYTSCLCGSERKTLSWTMTPSALGTVNVSVHAEAVPSSLLCGNDVVEVPERGRVDVVTRSLVIKAEGTEVSKTFNWLLCPKGDVLTEETELQLPWNLIEGSARASVSVLGDILGRALENLDQLLKMPFGCGEQNMVLLAPNIYILLYLENTKQLTPAIRSKATNFMISGYQRQLNYKLSNGAYSTFGSNPGITWLTAFVLRCFVRAQSFIYIDPKNIEEAKTWLMSKQQPNGCFEMSGKLFHNLMKGGVSDEVTLSAYITAAFLEMKTSADDPVVVRSLACLKESMSDLSNTYTTALMAYVFTLAGDTETRNHLLQHLDSVAVREGNSLHWSQKAAETSASLSVEISSYVLLAKLSSSPTDEDAAHASEISRWLIGQQNSYGGFTSTQDTVVALQALALYATVVYSLEGSSTVTVQAPSGALLFEVNPDNKLLYQERALQDVTGNFSLEAKGSACAAVQISLHYNIPTPIETSAFVLMVKATPQCSSNSETPRLSLEIVSLYRGKEDATNMVILDIKALSGFVPDTQSVKKLRHHWTVDRVDQKDDHILVYLRELKKDMAVSHTLELIQEVPVKNLKPAVVKIYDYYQPSDQAKEKYNYFCTAGSDLSQHAPTTKH
ncbi:alpha-2-macroglobulin-P-like [Salarias fasciatus]|uniref:alpha-2-macroglobulin-P-like n=1 Tax=Salarias fasciatus TaxID=181472 RepID=UPI001176DE4A|nr:alpha-2-macroglobulin-P-like [Salarias fasciatus]